MEIGCLAVLIGLGMVMGGFWASRETHGVKGMIGVILAPLGLLLLLAGIILIFIPDFFR